MMQMNRDQQTRLHALLMDEKRKLWNRLRMELFETLGNELHAQYDIPQDIGEKGIIDLLEDTGLAVADIRRQELTLMDEAVRKLAEGSYGICEDCGEDIAEARLRVVPCAFCCVRCQEKREGPGASGLTL